MFTSHELFPTLSVRLITERLILRMPTLTESVSVGNLAAEGIHDDDVRPFRVEWTTGTPLEVAQRASQWAMRHIGDAFDDNPRDDMEFSVFLKTNPLQPIGRFGIYIYDRVSSGAGTTSWLGKMYHGCGYGTEARLAMLSLIFDGLEMSRTSTRVFSNNKPSRRVTEKIAGYSHVDTVPNEDRPADTLVFEMFADDWHAHPRPNVELHRMDIARDYLGLSHS